MTLIHDLAIAGCAALGLSAVAVTIALIAMWVRAGKREEARR